MDTQSLANPWLSDKSLGSVGLALQCAEQTGVIRKVYNHMPLHSY